MMPLLRRMVRPVIGHHADFQSRELADDADQLLSHRGTAGLVELFEIGLEIDKNILGGLVIAA